MSIHLKGVARKAVRATLFLRPGPYQFELKSGQGLLPATP
jgi:hypothetical protein